MKLNGMILPIHEMETSIYRATIYSTHNLLPTWWPLATASTLCLEETLFRKSSILSLLRYIIACTALQMTNQIFTNGFLWRQYNRAR